MGHNCRQCSKPSEAICRCHIQEQQLMTDCLIVAINGWLKLRHFKTGPAAPQSCTVHNTATNIQTCTTFSVVCVTIFSHLVTLIIQSSVSSSVAVLSYIIQPFIKLRQTYHTIQNTQMSVRESFTPRAWGGAFIFTAVQLVFTPCFTVWQQCLQLLHWRMSLYCIWTTQAVRNSLE